MSKRPGLLRRIVTLPFRLIWMLLKAPFIGFKKLKIFLNEIPEERPLMDTVAGTFQSSKARASLMDHVEVLRKHLFRAIVVLFIFSGISFAFTIDLLDYLTLPIGGIGELQTITPTEQIGVFMQIALLSGFIISSPYIAFEIWLFSAPGLKPRAKKFGLFGIPLASLLFIGGVAFAYIILLPPALDFLRGFLETKNDWTLSEYIKFINTIMFWIGIFFEMPLLIYVLSSVGFVNPKVLQEQWRIAIVIIAILAAIITPTPDPLNMALVAVPMTMLYFISIGAGYIAYNRRKKQNT